MSLRDRGSADWNAWKDRFETSLGPDDFGALFADGGTFQDPVTAPTTDVRAVAEHTASIFPDWHQEVHTIRGGEDWAVFEWSGSGTYRGPGAEAGPGFGVTMQGATVIEVDSAGLVTRWRDYLDTNDAIQQVMAGLSATGSAPADSAELTSGWEDNFVGEPTTDS